MEDELVKSLGVLEWGVAPKIISDLSIEWLVPANMAVPAKVIRLSPAKRGFHVGIEFLT